MADGHDKSDESTVNECGFTAETYHEIESDEVCPTKMCLLIKITQSGQRPLPVGVITERSIMALVKRVSNVTPIGVTIMNDIDVVVEFGRGARLFEISAALHATIVWDKYQINIGCIFSDKRVILDMVRDVEKVREANHKTQQKYDELVAEEKRHRTDIQDLLERFESQVRRVELTSERIASIADMQKMTSSGVPSVHTVDTPKLVSSIEDHYMKSFDKALPFRTPNFSTFLGIELVLKGEGSYDQFMFQIKGYRGSHTDEAIKSGIIGAVTDRARDYLDFIGFDKKLPVLIEALETRYGKGQTTDKLQQEFYQLTQERNEQVQAFAGRLEFKYKRLINLYPGRYDLNILKERLFYGMTQHLRDSMRYLYKEPDTTYESLLSAATEAEAEWLENKTIKTKAASYIDPNRKERDELKARIDKLTAELAKKEKGGFFKKKQQKVTPETPTSSPKSSPRSKGPEITSHGPFHGGKKPIQCYKCGCWGHVIRECSTSGNVDWVELNRVKPPVPVEVDPELNQSKQQ